MKKFLFVFAMLIFSSFVFAEKKWAVWVIEEGSFWGDPDIGISFLTADSVSLENGFVKLENNIRFTSMERDPDFDRIFNEVNEAYKKSKLMGTGILLLNANRVFAIREFEE